MSEQRKPEIRFRGFTDDWEQRKLGNIYQKIRNAFVGTATPFYVNDGHFYLESNNVKDGQINRNSEIFINDEFYEKQKDNWLHTEDLVMVQSGHVGHTAVIPENLDNTAAHALIIIANPVDKTIPQYVNYYFQTQQAKEKIENITTGNTIKHILSSEMKKFEITLPKDEEQQMIAKYFEHLDNLITLHQRKHDSLTKIKKAMLEKMFPQDGKTVPEIRFKGFTDDWEQHKLGECFIEHIESMPEGEMLSVTIGSGIKKFSELGRYDNSNDDKSKYKKVSVGDIAYNSMRMWQGASGFSPYEGIVSPAYTVLSPIDGVVDSKCISYLFKRADMIHTFKLNSQGITSDNWNLKFPAFSQIEIMVSQSIEEQHLIAKYFLYLDNLITLHQRQLEKLQTIKKALLDKMFV